MSSDYGLTEADKEALHARLVSWFGDGRQAFLVSHLAPVVDRIKAEACAQAAAECQWNALEMARKADLAERRAEDAEAEVERLRSVLVEVRQVFDLQCPPMLPEKYVDQGAWVAHSWWNTVLGNVLKRADLIAALRPNPTDMCRHGSPEGECPSCTACAACRGECGTCPYVVSPPEGSDR
jgi:hypothetical protein